MDVFFVFLFFLIGLSSFLYSYFLLFLTVPLILYLFFIRKYKSKAFLFLLATVFSLLLMFLYPKGSIEIKELSGIIVKRRDNYALVLSNSGTYYVLDKGKLGNLFSIVTLKGYASKLSFSHYESGFSFKEYLNTQGVFYQFTYQESSIDFASGFSFNPLIDYAFSFLNDTSRELTESLLFASSLNKETFPLLSEMGLLSLFSVSGFHLSFLLYVPKLFIGKKHEKAYMIARTIFAILFLLLSSFRYGLIRYFLSSVLSLIAQFQTKRKLNSLERLSLVALFMLSLFPYSILSSGFYYSFPFLFYLKFVRRRKRTSKKLFFSISLFVFFYPYKLINNYGFSLFSMIFQFLLLPYSHLLFLLSMLLFIIPPLGIIINWLVQFLELFCSFSSSLNVFLVSGLPSVFYFIVFYSILILLQILETYGYKSLRKKAYVGLAIYSMLPFFPRILPRYEVDFIDVDQGASALVLNEYDSYLIDTGGKINTDLARECLIPYFHKKKLSSLTAVIITHLDYDHYGALESLQKNFSIKNVFYAEDFLKEKSNSLSIGSLTFTNLNDYHLSDDTNTTSGVYRFDVKNKKFLITGDAPKSVEKRLVKDKKDIDVDVLALGHHGSNTSSDKEFLLACSPSLCVISCGENNSYGFPHEETLNTLNELGLSYKRTDEDSTIEIKI